MITLTTAQLEVWMAMVIFPLARILAFLATAPLFNNAALPVQLRLVTGLAIALPAVAIMPPLPPVPMGSWLSLLILAEQMLIGTLMGFTARMLFAGVGLAGDLIGLQMGLSFAIFYDPDNAGQTPVLSEFLSLLALMVFLAGNGHAMLLAGLVESFDMLPVSAEGVAPEGIARMLQWAGTIFSLGVMLALPLVTSLLITSVALGVLSRVAPQLNLFAIGFPVTLATGFVVLVISLPYFSGALQSNFDQTYAALRMVILALKG